MNIFSSKDTVKLQMEGNFMQTYFHFYFYFYLVSDRLQLVEAYITFVGYACKKISKKLKG